MVGQSVADVVVVALMSVHQFCGACEFVGRCTRLVGCQRVV